jgi:para-aminobenzoate synthetase component 2
MILVVDNYDSFVFNVARYFEELRQTVRTVRNDAIDVGGVARLAPDAIVLSPGPCSPTEAGVSLDLVRAFSGRIPILGVCLGHQCIGEAFGGRVAAARRPLHGRATPIAHSGRGLFRGLPSPLEAARYHSLIVEPTPALGEAATIEATSAEGEIMALAHVSHPTLGVQFHPESILTERGHDLFGNFLDIARRWSRDAAVA